MRVLSQIDRFIRDNQRFLVVSHSRPDGDAIGSQLAFGFVLEQLGKTVDLVSADPCPPNYRSLPGIERIQFRNSANGDYDGVIVLECGNLERTGVQGLEKYPAINIDHHPLNDEFGIVNWIDPTAAAVAEQLFDLFQHMAIDLTEEITSNLYAAILTDTGSFRFANTTEKTFRTAAALVRLGASPAKIAESVLMRQSEERIRLLSLLLATLSFDPTRKISWVRLDRAMLQESGASSHDTEGLVNYPLSIDGVEMCAFFREEDERAYRVSLRSKGGQDVSQVAAEFGGGGHRNAAGLELEGGFEEIRNMVIGRLSQLLIGE